MLGTLLLSSEDSYKGVMPPTLSLISALSGGNLAYESAGIAPVCAACIETLSHNCGVADTLSACVRGRPTPTCLLPVAEMLNAVAKGDVYMGTIIK